MCTLENGNGAQNADQPIQHEGDISDTSDETYHASQVESSDDSDFDVFLDGDKLSDNCDPIDEGENLEGLDHHHEFSNYTKYEKLIEDEYKAYLAYREKGKIVERDNVSDDEILHVALNSSDDEQPTEFPDFNIEKDLEKAELEVGHIFTTVQDFRLALRQHSIVNGFELKPIKNDSDRVTAKCSKNCGWRIHASKCGDTSTFQIKTLKGVPHKCPRSYKNKSATARWLAQMFVRDIADDPSLKIEVLKKALKKKYNVNVGDQQLYRAKSKAKTMIQGEHKQQY